MPPRSSDQSHDDDDVHVSSSSSAMAPMTDDYNKLNQAQSTAWKYAQPLFEQALKNDGISTTKAAFRVADFGCATGGNSIAPLSFVASQIPPDCAFEVLLVDLPENAWSSVATTVTPDSIVSSSRDESASNIFINMVGRTFYEQCAPTESLDLSYSLVAVHWMRSYPCDLPSGLYSTDPLHVPEPEVLRAWKDAGAQDLLQFTKARHRELKIGGRFIASIACQKKTGEYPWSKVAMVVYKALLERVSSPDMLESCVMPCCVRSEADVRAGFVDNGWELEVCEFHETHDPVHQSLQNGDMTPVEYGKSVMQSFKAVCHSMFVGALTKQMPKDKVEELLDDVYENCIGTVAAYPDQYNLDISFWYVMARKTTGEE